MDTILVSNLEYVGLHGATSKEHKEPQKFKISVEADVENTIAAAKTDDINQTTDYRIIRNIVKNTIASPHQNLVETLANKIATDILAALPGIIEVRVRLEKSEIWQNGAPGIIVRRNRNV